MNKFGNSFIFSITPISDHSQPSNQGFTVITTSSGGTITNKITGNQAFTKNVTKIPEITQMDGAYKIELLYVGPVNVTDGNPNSLRSPLTDPPHYKTTFVIGPALPLTGKESENVYKIYVTDIDGNRRYVEGSDTFTFTPLQTPTSVVPIRVVGNYDIAMVSTGYFDINNPPPYYSRPRSLGLGTGVGSLAPVDNTQLVLQQIDDVCWLTIGFTVIFLFIFWILIVVHDRTLSLECFTIKTLTASIIPPD